MTPDERLNEIEQGWNTPYDCRVCVGLSPSWDGHDRSCRGRVWESVPWLIGQLRDARAEIDEVGAQVHIQHDRAIRAEAALVDARVEIERLNGSRSGYVAAGLALERERDQLQGELAAERAKVERVEAVRQIMLTSPNQSVRAWATTDLRAALTGGEQ